MGALLEDGETREKLAVWNGAVQGAKEAAFVDGVNRSWSDEKGRKTVVVGIRMDAQGRELLTWALVKAADPGNRVVALHVLRSAAAADGTDQGSHLTSCSSLITLIKSFDSVLAAYEGFCSLKQIDLKIKICRGSSLRKALVREASGLGAAKLVLGVAKNKSAIGPSTSIAKYCAKKLPRGCSVLAVDNGKVVFQREAPPTELEELKDCNRGASLLLEVPHTSTKNSKVTNRSDVNLKSPLAPKSKEGKKDISLSSCEFSSVSPKSLCSFSAAVTESAQGAKRSQGIQAKKDESMGVVPARPRSLSFLVNLPQARPGWPLLRKAILHDKRTASGKRKTSVIQWVMRLPTQYSSSAAVHPNQKPLKSTVNATPNVDRKSEATVLLGNVASHPLDAVHDEEQGKFPKGLETLHLQYSSCCRLFSYHELMIATSNFSAEKLVGKGGSSQVYKGCLPDGKEIAVKFLQRSEDVLKEFVLEVEIITTLHHKNIISLFGFCFENNNFILVYEFLSRGSLEDNLHGNKKEKSSLGWMERYKVAMGVAEALDYLHGAGIPQPVIHRDVKTSNILLLDDCEPQLSDFGLAKWASSTSSHIACSDVAGTFGYLAPEYFMYGKVDDKIDVYAFGVVLLELLTGRKPINTGCPKGQESLVMWAKPILERGKAAQLLDPSLGDKYDHDQVERMILAASLCIRRVPQLRPMMAIVLKLLQGDSDIVKWARLQVDAPEESGAQDDEPPNPSANLQSHLSLALLDVEDDSFSSGSAEHMADYMLSHGTLDDYLKGRWSRSSSFDLQ